MSSKLQQVTDKLYREGIEKVRGEARAIISDAREQKKVIIRKAREEADSIVEKAKSESVALKASTEGEIDLAVRQAELTLRERIVNMFSGGILRDGVARALSEKEFLASMIENSFKVWVSDGKVPEASVLLGGDADFRVALSSLLRKRLGDSPVVEFSERLKNKTGFKLEAKDGSCSISFTDSDFQEFFRSFFRKETRHILFGDS